jgi:NAD(P)H-flavin reductase
MTQATGEASGAWGGAEQGLRLRAGATSAPPQPHPWRTHTVAIREITPELDGVATYHLAFRDPAAAESYRFAPGQFNMLYLPGAGEIPISLSEDPRATESFAHTVRVAGNVTRTLARLQPGETLGLRGPFGTAWPLQECAGRDVVLVAGGIGLAPLRPAIYALLYNVQQDGAGYYGRLHLLYGARSPGTLLYTSQYENWASRRLNVQTTVDRSAPGWNGNVGVVPLLLERLRDFNPQNTMLLACGPEVMMKFTVKAALQRGMPPERIWLSLERNMHCAVGLCGHCQLGPEFICKDGPVFRYDRIVPFLNVEAF